MDFKDRSCCIYTVGSDGVIAGFCSTAETCDPFLQFLGETCDTCLWRGDVKTSVLTRVGESTVSELVLDKEYYLFTALLRNRLSV